jgi:hypothetical protein
MPLFPPPQLIQTVFSEISANTTTTSGTFVDLLTVTLTTGPTQVEIYFTASASNNAFAGASLQFQITIDAVAQRGCKVRSFTLNSASCGAIFFRSGQLSIGSHTIKVQWLTDVGTAQIRPVTTIQEHGSLLVNEITV